MRQKQLQKGLEQLTEEGLAQLFTREDNGRRIVGTVGALQFDVIQYRLEHEYGAHCTYEPLPIYKACWIGCDDDETLKQFKSRKMGSLAQDKNGNLVFLAESAWTLKITQENFENISFYFTSEFNTKR
jgi:peptide chain release factor 3